MGAPEVLWRVRQLVQKKASKWGVGLCHNPPAPRIIPDTFFLPCDAMPSPEPVYFEADRILNGRWRVFALNDLPLGFPPNWNRDPKTGTVAPMLLGKTIDYRSERNVGDIKYLWEPSRHLELVTLAQAWRLSGDFRYANAARELLTSWMDQCPYPMGIHWTSSLELAVRLVNWAFAWQLLGGLESPLFVGEEGQKFQRRWLDSVYQHCHFIQGYFSRHSSANNHLFGEYMGLFVASATWPYWEQSKRWQTLAKAGLETEARIQNTADGVNREQAIYYQHEVMDMMLLCQRVGQAHGTYFSDEYLARLLKLAEFVSSLMDVGGNVPMIGDADDAQMVRLAYQSDWSPYRSLLASCAILFNRADFKDKAGTLDDKTQWLFGAQGGEVWATLHARPADRAVMAFPEGGYFILGRELNTEMETRLVVDCAPLGYLSIAAHGHADALAFTLSSGGEELLIDPGTYAYHTQKKWRDYFRGTAAHNTVQIDGLDQSEIGGNFMWLRKANAQIKCHDLNGAIQIFEGEHDGYARLADPVTHRRRIEFDANTNVILVKDILQCQREHQVALHWHFAEKCTVSIDSDTVSAVGKRNNLMLRCTSGADMFNIELLRGSESPLGGWISRTFDQKSPITTAVWRGVIGGRTEIVTQLQIRACSEI